MANIDFNQMISRLSFEKRAFICENISRNRLSPTGPVSPQKLSGKREPYNFELELIAFHSVLIQETEIDYYLPSVWMKRVTNILRQQTDYINKYNKDGREKAWASVALTQFHGQQNYTFLFYRYHHIFTYRNASLDMNKEFYNRFGVDFSDYMNFTFCCQLWVKSSLKTFHELSMCFLPKMIKILNQLSSSREEMKNNYCGLMGEDNNLSITDLNLLLVTPFIKHRNLFYCPYVPYIPYACTESLMFAITQGNNSLREKIGKNAIESYVNKLVNESKVTNCYTIHEEFEYIYKKNKELSSDVIVHSNTHILFIETKFFNQNLKVRSFDDVTIHETKMRLAKGIRQLYIAISKAKDGALNNNINCAHVLKSYGFLVIYDEFSFSKLDSYDWAKDILQNEGYQVTIDDLMNLIVILPLSSLESILCYSSDDIFTFCNLLFQDKKMIDNKIYLPFHKYENITNIPDLEKFMQSALACFKNDIVNLINFDACNYLINIVI